MRAFVSTEKNTSPWTYIEENLGDMTGMERYHRCAECMEYPHSKGSKYVNISVPWSIWVVISVFWGAGLVFIFYVSQIVIEHLRF